MTGRPRVLLTAFHYPPEVSGGVPRILSIERFLVERGAEVTLLTPQPVKSGRCGSQVIDVPFPPYYSEATGAERKRPLYRRVAKRWVLMPDVFITWAVPAARRASLAHRRKPFDLVITSAPPESMHLVGLMLASRGRCAWVADFCDGWTFEPLRREASLPLRRNLERTMERLVVSRSDFITAATRPIVEDLKSRYPLHRKKMMWLPPAFERFFGGRASARGGRFHLVYTGRFSRSDPRRSPKAFFDGLSAAFARVPEMKADFRLTLMGDLSDEERLISRQGNVADVVTEIAAASQERALEMGATATMLLLLTSAGAASVATRKLFDYLSLRRPIFALAAGNEAAAIIEETRSGLCVAPDDPLAVAEGILKAYRLWKSGRLEESFPMTGNHLYLASNHLERTLGRVIDGAGLLQTATI